MSARVRVLFVVEGFTDIRFVLGLSRIAELTMLVPQRAYLESGLDRRLAQAGLEFPVVQVPGGRLRFQVASLAPIWRLARHADVILAQEVLRGALNANIVGALRRTPVITYLAVSPLEYFRCRRERGRIGPVTAFVGEAVIRALMMVNGLLARRCLAMGAYLQGIAARYCARTSPGLYYGVDTSFFRPADAAERRELRRRLDLPADRFLIFLSSRISHEKDPETVLRTTALARARGLDAVLLNLGGGFAEFLGLARALHLPDAETWVLGRPAAHPMTEVADYFRTADAMALASLAEGLGISPLESLACGTPVVATAVGGMAVELPGYARLVPRGDADAMAEQLLWIAAHPDEARAEALRGRAYVEREWNREKAFDDLRIVLEEVASERHQGHHA